MRIAEVIGKVTLSQCLPPFEGALLPLVVPLGLAQLREDAAWDAESLVVYDPLGAGPQDRIALSEGGRRPSRFCPNSNRWMHTTRRYSMCSI